MTKAAHAPTNQKTVLQLNFFDDLVYFSFKMTIANAVANPLMIRSENFNENKLEVRSRMMGLTAKDRIRPIPSLTIGWRFLKLNNSNAQPMTYPGKTITSGNRQNAWVAPMISCSVKFTARADKVASSKL